ncbi:MAG: 1-(5-phosphoribosyl)-5-[(5-phosphoribosylamino)methylideneamino]imidazole-4-carboxamide isomerase [Holosporales bacterium]|jgi:phosphoribosylformimino-5-aminoimidazole carboxamide ribotide isomerase
MLLFPAIDLLDGACVRLTHGDYNKVTVYNDDPGEQAATFAAAGATWLHVVDLDGARSGQAVNIAAIKAIRRAARVSIQLGGGIRSLASMDAWLAVGIDRVILGTVALTNPQLVREACKAFPGKIAVSIDSRDGHVATAGWLETSTTRATDLARLLADSGVSVLIHTDIGRDGVKTGVNVESCVAMAAAAHLPVIASGGVASLDDIRAVKALENKGIIGAISGRALYDGTLDLQAALALC